MSDEKQVLSAVEVGRLIGASRARVYQLCAERRLPHVREGRSVRFPRRALEQWLEGMAATAMEGLAQRDREATTR